MGSTFVTYSASKRHGPKRKEKRRRGEVRITAFDLRKEKEREKDRPSVPSVPFRVEGGKKEEKGGKKVLGYSFRGRKKKTSTAKRGKKGKKKKKGKQYQTLALVRLNKIGAITRGKEKKKKKIGGRRPRPFHPRQLCRRGSLNPPREERKKEEKGGDRGRQRRDSSPEPAYESREKEGKKEKGRGA